MNELREQFSELTTEYLLQMLARGDDLTGAAHHAIEEILKERGEPLPKRPSKPIYTDQSDPLSLGLGKFFKAVGQGLLIVFALLASEALSGTWIGYFIAFVIAIGFILVWQWRSNRTPEQIQFEKNEKIMKEEGLTEFMVCAGNGDMERIRELVEYGADLNARSSSGNTALMYAARNDQLPIVTFLLNSGADPTLRSKNGMTAADIARKFGNAETAAYLKQGKHKQ